MIPVTIKDCYEDQDTVVIAAFGDHVCILCEERTEKYEHAAYVNLDIEGIDLLLAALYEARSHLCWSGVAVAWPPAPREYEPPPSFMNVHLRALNELIADAFVRADGS